MIKISSVWVCRVLFTDTTGIFWINCRVACGDLLRVFHKKVNRIVADLMFPFSSHLWQITMFNLKKYLRRLLLKRIQCAFYKRNICVPAFDFRGLHHVA